MRSRLSLLSTIPKPQTSASLVEVAHKLLEGEEEVLVMLGGAERIIKIRGLEVVEANRAMVAMISGAGGAEAVEDLAGKIMTSRSGTASHP